MTETEEIDRKGSVGLIILLVGVVLAIAVGVWYYKTHNNSITQTPNQSMGTSTTASIVNSSSPTIDTAVWQTYHNTIYGYTISYPPDANIQYNNLQDGNTEAGVDTVPANSPAGANQIVISINTSTFPDVLTAASVDIMPSQYYVGATGMGIGDKTINSTFVFDDVAYPANGIDSSADDGSIFMDAQVGKVEVGYAFSSADLKAINETEFSEVQNELLAIIGTLHFDK